MTVFQISLIAILALALSIAWATYSSGDYFNADRSSVGIAPNPKDEPEAVVQIYSARAFSWRGVFSRHLWLAVKKKSADQYMIYQVIGWRLYRNLSAISAEPGMPDRKWFGSYPKILFSLKGEVAEQAISKIEKAVQEYPYANEYRAWPGPNSNTFISYLVRNSPEIRSELPNDAIGKDWLGTHTFWAKSESKTGFQISIFGVLGLIVGLREGIEINILALSFGIDFLRPALKLPLIGRIGVPSRTKE